MLTDDDIRELWNTTMVNSDERGTFAPVLTFARTLLAQARAEEREKMARFFDESRFFFRESVAATIRARKDATC